MTINLIVETGTKPIGANSYIALADADTYHTNFGNTDWTGNTDDEARKQALVLATQAVDLLYGARYMSSMYPGSTQDLLFPRAWFTDADARIITENTIPQSLKAAVCEVALLQLMGEDIFPQASTASLVKAKQIKAGDIESKTEYFRTGEGESFSGFRKIDIVLRPILRNASVGQWRLHA